MSCTEFALMIVKNAVFDVNIDSIWCKMEHIYIFFFFQLDCSVNVRDIIVFLNSVILICILNSVVLICILNPS